PMLSGVFSFSLIQIETLFWDQGIFSSKKHALNYNWKCLYWDDTRSGLRSEIIFVLFLIYYVDNTGSGVGKYYVVASFYGFEDFHGYCFAFHVLILLVFLMIKSWMLLMTLGYGILYSS
ncbi:hypothetical protein ACJX0J_024755, partial [Zea mays]